jgi:hypothetical protein
MTTTTRRLGSRLAPGFLKLVVGFFVGNFSGIPGRAKNRSPPLAVRFPKSVSDPCKRARP